jgi:hypothetical protein
VGIDIGAQVFWFGLHWPVYLMVVAVVGIER